MLTFKLLLWLIPIALNVWADRNGRKPHYLIMFILRGMAAILHGALIISSEVPEWYLSGWQLVKLWLPYFTFHATSFWILFELCLNILQKRDPLYYDQKEKDSGWLDKLFAWAGPRWHAIAKFAALEICIYCLIQIYQ